MPSEPINLPVVILAAGLSGRMGVLKPFLKWDNKTTFIEKIISEYIRIGSENIIVVVNFMVHERIQKELPQLYEWGRFIVNPEPEKGKFLSLRLGLNELVNPDYCFIQNIDNPFIDAVLLGGMAELRVSDGYVVPRHHRKTGHPLLAGKQFLDYIQTLEINDYNLRLLLNPFRRMSFETEHTRVLININSENDYISAFGHLY